MDDTNFGGRSADQGEETAEGSEAWVDLRSRLAGQLARMTDDGDHLLLEMPEGSGLGCTPYAQFAGFGDQMLRAELSSNAYLAPAHALDDDSCGTLQMMGWRGRDESGSNWYVERPVRDAPIIATMVVGALQLIFGIEHPQLLTYDAFGPHGSSADELGLIATDDVEVELAQTQPVQLPAMLTPSGHDELTSMVTATLHSWLGMPPTIDADGDVVLTHLDQPVWVRVRQDQPAVEILARVAHGVHSRRATAAEIALLNRDHLWTTWVLRGRDVYMQLAVPAYPFAPGHLTSMLEVFLAAMSATRDDLAFRVGGKVA